MEGARDSGLIRVGAGVGGHTERAKTLTWMSQSLGAAAGIGRGEWADASVGEAESRKFK